MSHPPLRRFLGLDENSSDHALLGLQPDECGDRERVAQALADRLDRLERHPSGRSADAMTVRQCLGAAAARLIGDLDVVPVQQAPPRSPAAIVPDGAISLDEQDEVAREPEPPPRSEHAVPVSSTDQGGQPPATKEPTRPGDASVATLNDFDRTVLAILVGSGGWNAESRGRLIELASRRGLKPAALMRIVNGLSHLLQGGGFEGVAGAPRAIDVALPPAKVARPPTKMEVRMNQISEVLASEMRGDTAGSRLRLGILFSVIGIVLSGLFMALLMLPSPAIEAARRKAAEAAAREELLAASNDASVDSAPVISGGFMPDDSGVEEFTVQPVIWERPPTFRGDSRPTRAILRSHDAPEWIKGLETIARKSSLPRPAGGSRIFIDYTAYLDDAASCWPLLEPGLRGQLVVALAEPAAVGVTLEVREQFLDLIDAGFVTLNKPEDVWKSAWSAGLLAGIIADPLQPEGVRSLATLRLNEELGSRRRVRGEGESPFQLATGRKLDRMVPELVQLAVIEHPDVLDAWEYWIQAQKAVRTGLLAETAWLEAALVILEEGYALERPGALTEILGRLLSELDLTTRSLDPDLVRSNLRSWFESPEIPSDNLWVLTSILARSADVPWWDARHVLDPAATVPERRAFMDRVEMIWPERLPTERPRGIPVPGELLDRIDRVRHDLHTDLRRGDRIEMLHRLVACSRLAATVELFEQGERLLGLEELGRAEELAGTDVERMLHPEFITESVGVSRDRDGLWAAQWKDARRGEREPILRQLKQRSGGDLGPVDAAALAAEAYRGQGMDILLLARKMITDQFPYGPNMALALLDEFGQASRNAETNDFLFSLGVLDLPTVTDPNWHAKVRLALARHAFALQESTLHDIDRLVEDHADVLRNRFDQLGGEAYLRDSTPEEVASALAGLMDRRARDRFVSDPIPADLEELRRRRSVRWASAVTSAQQLVAELTSIADIAFYETASLRPDLRKALMEEHMELTTRVSAAPDVLHQLLELELALVDLVILRLEPEEDILQ